MKSTDEMMAEYMKTRTETLKDDLKAIGANNSMAHEIRARIACLDEIRRLTETLEKISKERYAAREEGLPADPRPKEPDSGG